MQRLILQRLMHAIVVLFVVSLCAFALIRIAPGDPIAAMIGEQVRTINPAEVARIRKNLGLDDPFIVQYVRWLGGMVQGDWGVSLAKRQPTLLLISDRIGPTLKLVGVSLLCSIVLGLTLGVISALKRYTWVDHLISTLTFIGNSLPQVWVGLILVYLFAVQLKWLPASGSMSQGGGGFFDQLRYMILPVATLSISNLVLWVRYQRASMLEALSQEYIRVAQAKGLAQRTVILRHAWRNALIPIVTLLGNSVGFLIEGAYIVELIFAWPGMGRLGVEAIMSRDYPVMMAVVIISALFITAGNLIADILYGFVNPRLRVQSS